MVIVQLIVWSHFLDKKNNNKRTNMYMAMVKALFENWWFGFIIPGCDNDLIIN